MPAAADFIDVHSHARAAAAGIRILAIDAGAADYCLGSGYYSLGYLRRRG